MLRALLTARERRNDGKEQGKVDHWTTFGAAEAKAASEAGYLRLRSLGWAPNASHAAGTDNASKPVYLYYSLFRHDHFSSPEAVAPHGYLAKGRQGYLLSGTDPSSQVSPQRASSGSLHAGCLRALGAGNVSGDGYVALGRFFSPQTRNHKPSAEAGDNVLAEVGNQTLQTHGARCVELPPSDAVR